MKKMRLTILPVLLLGFCFTALASQELDTLEQKPASRIVPYIQFMLEGVGVDDRTIIQKGFSAGITINEKLNLGIYSNWHSDDLNFRKIGLPELRMKYMHGGVHTSYNHSISRLLSLNVSTRVGQGSVRLLQNSGEFGIMKQRVVIMHPDVGLEIAASQRTKVQLNVGYRLMTDLKMQEIVKGDLTGFSYGVNIKFDLFKSSY